MSKRSFQGSDPKGFSRRHLRPDLEGTGRQRAQMAERPQEGTPVASSEGRRRVGSSYPVGVVPEWVSRVW